MKALGTTDVDCGCGCKARISRSIWVVESLDFAAVIVKNRQEEKKMFVFVNKKFKDLTLLCVCCVGEFQLVKLAVFERVCEGRESGFLVALKCVCEGVASPIMPLIILSSANHAIFATPFS